MTKDAPKTKWIYLVALALIWGSSFILMKKGLVIFSPIQVAGLRIFVACCATLPFIILRLHEVQPSSLKYIALVGVLGSGLPAFLFTTAQMHISSYLAGMLNGLTPVFTLLIGAAIFKTRFTAFQIAGVAVGFIGAAALIYFRSGADFFSGSLYPALIVLATACYGMSVNTIKAKLSKVDSFLISGVSLIMVGVPYGLYLFLGTDFSTRLMQEPGAMKAFSSIVLLAVMGTAISNILYFQMVKISSPLFASAVTYLIPLVALAWGLGDGEALNLLHLPAMAAILAGVALISYRKN